jgi:hypothetical protein
VAAARPSRAAASPMMRTCASAGSAARARATARSSCCVGHSGCGMVSLRRRPGVVCALLPHACAILVATAQAGEPARPGLWGRAIVLVVLQRGTVERAHSGGAGRWRVPPAVCRHCAHVRIAGHDSATQHDWGGAIAGLLGAPRGRREPTVRPPRGVPPDRPTAAAESRSMAAVRVQLYLQ